MRRSTAALLLTTVLTALLPPQTAATILKCYCSDCPQEQSICYGEVCTRQTLYNFYTGAKVSERWRCLNDSFASCNISSSLLSYECCSSHDFCNNENCTTSHFEESTNRTNNYRCETGNFTGTSLTTNSSEETNCTTGSEDAELMPEINTSYPSFVPEGDRFQCHEAESTNPQNFNFTFCETSTTCFNSLRIRNDGSRIFRWGCSREDPAHSCAEENRNRKKKTCCRGWFCNKDLPTDWVKGNENETTPTMTTPTDATPTNSTRPLPAEISTDSPPTEEETPSNCTLAEEGGSSDIKPCAGPGSVIELTPEEFEVVPITTEIGDSWNFFCYCTTCPDSYIICGSHFGCATLYSYDISVTTGGPSIVTSHSCLSRDEFVSCGNTPGLVCCLSNFCNAPHSLNLTETPPTGSPTEPITAGETYPIEIPSVTEASLTEGSPTNQNTVNPSTITTPHVQVNPLSPPTLVNSSGTEFEQSNEEDEDLSLLFYALSAVLAVLLTALILVMVVLIFCCYGYNKKKHMEQSSSPRRPQITTATRESIAQVTGRSNFVMVKVEDRELCSRIESAKVEHSCTTESTYTQPSSPESTV